MLQRAASNAYSRRTTTNFRTKQSKWLDQSLQDMELKVQYVLKLIQEDGDSFAKRAEMYYKKRPELVNFVEESNRAYRALAERYEHLSIELQNTNNTLATLFPEQFQMPIDDEDDSTSSKPSNSPKFPKSLNKEWKSSSSSSSPKQLQARITPDNELVSKPNLSKQEALEEINKLQKDILALQTVKEFVKTSYQGGLSRYWGIENQILEMQRNVTVLTEEFGLNNNVIDDNEARTLMAEAALKSCQETLTQLQETKEKHDQDAKKEYNKIEDAREKLNSIRLELLNDTTKSNDHEDKKLENQEIKNSNSFETEQAHENSMDDDSITTITILTDKIDGLVNNVLNLETEVSNQAILIERLRTEADDLHSKIRALEQDKSNLINDTQNLRTMINKLEEILNGIQKLNRVVEIQSNNFQTSLSEACSSLDNLSEKLSNVKPDEKRQEVLDQESSEKLVECECDTNDISTTILESIDESTIKEIQSGKSSIRTRSSNDQCISIDQEDEQDIKCISINQPQVIISPQEVERIRQEIDQTLDENLDYMLRYSNSYHQIKKFDYAIKDFRNKIEKLKVMGNQDETITWDLKTETWAIHSHLREIQKEQTIWLEQILVLKDELEKKFSKLCKIQDKIVIIMGIESDHGIRYSNNNQADKFQGEIMNMKQENNKIKEQMQKGIDYVNTLQIEISGIIRNLKEFEISVDNSFNQTKIPLRAFIFGTKKKKNKSSIFSRILSKRSRT